MGKMIFVDLTRCTGCRGCQVACKQWKDLPAEDTRNTGSHQNPPDLSDKTIRLVRFSEAQVDGKLDWLFFPEQCRHCRTAPCKQQADRYSKGAFMHDEATGAVYTTKQVAEIKGEDARNVREACPYDIPRVGADGKGLYKCDFCFDRIQAGMLPACVLACAMGVMNYGDEEDMLALAKERLAVVRKEYPKAYLGDPGNVRVLYLYAADHRLYYQDPIE